ncbi:molybdopterin-guanine dinucleotide biosynthesis protein A [Candidatus Magnetobacterium bavaricum]|uniref:Probable molybdenum cofactor guanylyltransferase n=1 Tax=Candidatus Magnetobacterium bavaricum TaxID=29290 RepID=A0A0F3GLG8_9BACT|nr:molybdopterin-guanine dinucleotide biosynthesis protein A [Candidatus Magnetobacterium bavaricum]
MGGVASLFSFLFMGSSKVDAIVLAGGQNTRFPTLKGFITLGDEAILDRNLSILRGFFGECFISTNSPEVYFSRRARLIGDVIDARGPATGILSALLATGAEDVFVVACDMPLVKKELVEFIARSQVGYDAVVAVYEGVVQPLLGIYNRRSIPVIERAIAGGRKRLRDVLGMLNVRYLTQEEFSTIDNEGESFVNVNTPLDLKRLMQSMDLGYDQSNR